MGEGRAGLPDLERMRHRVEPDGQRATGQRCLGLGLLDLDRQDRREVTARVLVTRGEFAEELSVQRITRHVRDATRGDGELDFLRQSLGAR